MILDIKKLFTKGTSLGRFEYLKVTWGLLLFPAMMIQLTIMTPSNNWLYNPVAILAMSTLLAYLIIFWVATYKRFNNIFDNTSASVISLIIYFFCDIIKPLRIILSILLIIIPGKKKSDYVVTGKLFWITFPLAILLFLSSWILGINRWIPSQAMNDTLQVNDRIYINIFDKDYKRGDIIILATDKKRVVYVKRIVALPGEKVEIKQQQDGAFHIFINDKMLNEPYVKNIYDYPDLSSMPHTVMIVPDNSYYVVGDNRGNSLDSRYYGAIHRDLIKGKVSHIWYPLNRRHVFTPPKYFFTETIEKTSNHDTLINDIPTYMDYMQKRIKTNWNPPHFDSSMTVTVRFTIRKDGTITNPKIKTSSGNKEMDNLAIATIRKVAKLRPLPAEITKQHDKTDVEFTFTYNLKKNEKQ